MLNSVTIAIPFLFMIIACQPREYSGNADDAMEVMVLPDDFIEFYDRFHADSSYQIEHIVFPLSLKHRDTTTTDTAYELTASNWQFHRKIAPDDYWSIEYYQPVEGVIVEHIFSRLDGFWIERRFAKSTVDWYLIYYSGLQQMDEKWK